MNIVTRVITPGLLFVITIITGFIVSYLGRPYQVIIFNVHKLIALAVIIILVLLFKNYFSIIRSENILIIFLVIAVLSVIILFVTGALLSIGKVLYMPTKIIHSIMPILLFISLSISIYLLSNSKYN